MDTPRRKSDHEGSDKDSSAKRARIDFAETITMKVGPSEQSFVVHKDILCAKSPFFAAACSSRWVEGNTRIVKLPETEPQVFEVFVQWAYSDKLDMSLMTVSHDVDEDKIATYRALTKVWNLSNYLGSNAMCNAAIDRMLIRLEKSGSAHMYISAGTAQYIWATTAVDCPVRRLVLDMGAANLELDDLEMLEEEYPREIITDLARRFLGEESREDALPTMETRCKYHLHEEGASMCT